MSATVGETDAKRTDTAKSMLCRQDWERGKPDSPPASQWIETRQIPREGNCRRSRYKNAEQANGGL